MSNLFSGVSLPFDVVDLFQSTMSFLKVNGGFILLGIVVTFAPQLIRLFKNAITDPRNKKRDYDN
jgi:hypothetical protein